MVPYHEFGAAPAEVGTVQGGENRMASKGIEEQDMDYELSPTQAAAVLDISVRTVNNYLRSKVLRGKQSITGRRSVRAAEIFRLIDERGLRDTEYAAEVSGRLQEEIAAKKAKTRAEGTRSNVLAAG